MTENPFRAIPSLDELRRYLETRGQSLAPALVQAVLTPELETVRAEIASGMSLDRELIVERIAREILRLTTSALSPVINATGVLLHTNLGRAPVSPSAARAMHDAASEYVSLETDRETGKRGSRMTELSRLMRLLTGAERALVVNNNAAALLLTLTALARNRGVIVSRGEAVEIGGGFRIPEVAVQSGATLVEVGTTNRTYPRDYAGAVGPETAAILKVHASNFSIRGFVRAASVVELASVARNAGILLIEDLGSGALLDTTAYGLEGEPTIGDQIAAGADVITASGDKLLGGPQAGIIAGRAEIVEQIERHPLARAVRADKTCLAGLGETLRHYVRGEATSVIPIWRMISTPVAELTARAVAIRETLASDGRVIEVVDSVAATGGGSLPGQELPSIALKVTPAGSVDAFARSIRMGTPGVFGRIEAGRLLLDLRSVLPEQDEVLARAVATAIDGEPR